MKNESSRALVERVNAAQEEPFIWQIDISALDIDYSVKTLIMRCYEIKQPFGLTADGRQNTVYFFPVRQLEGEERYKEIVEQLKQLG